MNNCEKCGKELQIGEHPFCPHGFGTSVTIGDECDVWIRHGICHPGGAPRHFTSKAEMARAAKEAGKENVVRHIDGSKHTSRWI